MSRREVNPRVGNYSNQQQLDDAELQSFIERTPQTKEQMRYEKDSSGWEYSAWMIIIIGIVIVLLVLLLWFIFKKDEVTELQRQIQPNPNLNTTMRRPQQPTENKPTENKPTDTESQETPEEKLAREAREALAKKKVVKRDIGPVPGIFPDNPSVVGIKDTHNLLTQKPQENLITEPTQLNQPNKPQTVNLPSNNNSTTNNTPNNLPGDNLSEINTPAVVNRMMLNFGLPSD